MSAADRGCMVCGANLAGRRADALTCSAVCRQRLKRGTGTSSRPRTVDITQAQIDQLVDHGHVAEWDENNRGALSEAIRKILGEVFAEPER